MLVHANKNNTLNFLVWLGGSLVWLMAMLPAAHGDDKQSQYQKSVDAIGKEIKQITLNLNANRVLLKTEQDKLATVEQRIERLQASISESQQKISQAKGKSENTQRLIATAKADKQGYITNLQQLIRQRYIDGQPSYVKMMLNQENPYAVGRLENYYDYFARAQQTQINKASQELANIAELEQQQQQTLSQLKIEEETLRQQYAQFHAARNQRSQSIARLDKKVASTEQKLKGLRQDRSRLNSLLKQIAEQAQALRRLEKQEPVEQGLSNSTAQRGELRRPKRALVKGGFKRQRGRLACPLADKPKQRFGNRIAESGMRSQGLLYTTGSPKPVTSIYSGKVLFADYLKGYGLLLIIDHGDDHISLYGHNEVIYKKVGDSVEVDEIISKTGTSGGLKQPSLYFEVRNGTIPVDPSAWCR